MGLSLDVIIGFVVIRHLLTTMKARATCESRFDSSCADYMKLFYLMKLELESGTYSSLPHPHSEAKALLA